MKRIAAWAVVMLLLLVCAYAYAEGTENLVEIRCEEWHFSVRIPSGMKAVPYDCEDEEYEKTIGGGLAVSAGGEDAMPRLWILRRDHAFNNPAYYLTGFFWEYLNETSEEIYDDIGYGLFRYGGITLRGSGARFLGDEDEELYTEYRFIPCRDDRGTEFVLHCTAETEQEAFSLLDTVIRNYLPDEEPQKAEARYTPVRQETDPESGTFRVSFEDVDMIETEGYFTAVLYTTDVYTAEDVFSMKPGDTLQINGRVFTLSDIDNSDPEYEVDVSTEESTREQSLWGFIFEKALSGDGYNLYVMDDWHSLSRVASVKVDASLPVAYYSVPGGDDPELMDENMLDNESGILALTQLTPYNTTCTMENGKLVRIDAASYPVGPVDPFVPVEVE